MAAEIEQPLLLRVEADGIVRLDPGRAVYYHVVRYHRGDDLAETAFVHEHVGAEPPTGEQLRQAALDHESLRRGSR